MLKYPNVYYVSLTLFSVGKILYKITWSNLQHPCIRKGGREENQSYR